MYIRGGQTCCAVEPIKTAAITKRAATQGSLGLRGKIIIRPNTGWRTSFF